MTSEYSCGCIVFYTKKMYFLNGIVWGRNLLDLHHVIFVVITFSLNIVANSHCEGEGGSIEMVADPYYCHHLTLCFHVPTLLSPWYHLHATVVTITLISVLIFSYCPHYTTIPMLSSVHYHHHTDVPTLLSHTIDGEV